MKTLLLQKAERVRIGLLCMFLLALVPNMDGASYVVAWGDDRDERTSVPPGITNGVAVAGLETSFALLSDGTVMVWGPYETFAGNLPPGLSDIAAIASGWNHALALRSNGTVIAWGNNSVGQTNLPVGLTNVTKIAAGYNHSLALRSNGTVAAWGWDFATNVPPGLTNVVAISAGGGHSLALRSNGTVVAWGDNSSGQINVPAGLANVLAIAAGEVHSLALRSNRTVVAWGGNSFGQTNVPPGLSNVIMIAAGETHNLAVTSDGKLVAWGHPSRTNTPPGLTNVTSIAAGRFHSLAVASVDGGAPVVTRNPSDRYIYSGMPTILTVAAEGAPALVYQWRFEGTTNIEGATNSTLALTNVQLAGAGDYAAVVSNPQGTAVSINARMTVTDSIPFFELQPQGAALYAGSDYPLSARAVGSWPLIYQWRINSNAIPGATNSSLILSNVQLADKGYYDVVVSNPVGTNVSTVAFINYFDLDDGLNTNLSWVTTGDAPWFGVNGWPNNDYFIPVARSGKISTGQTSSIQTTVTGPGTLRFSWMVCSLPLVDYLAFAVNGVERARISGNDADDFTDWSIPNPPFYLGPGTHELRWTFHKTSSGSSGNSGWLEADAAWLTRVTLTNGATLPFITAQPTHRVVPAGANLTFSCNAQGTPPLNFQWQFNGVDLAGATGKSLTLANVQPSQRGSYRVRVSNDYGSTLSSDANLSVDYAGPTYPTDPLDRWYLRDSRVFNKVEFAGGRFVGLGDIGSLATSEDGRNWETRPTGVSGSLRGVTYGSQISKYVAVGQYATILTSSDGTNWTRVVTSHTCDLNDIAWSGTAFVAVGTRAQTGQPNALRSVDGVNWTAVTFPGGTPSQFGAFVSTAVTFADGVFIAAGGIPFTFDLFRSVNGTAWSFVADSDQIVYGMTYGSNRFLVAGEGGYPRVSTNAGLSWFAVGDTNVCNPLPGQWCRAANDVAFGNGTFIMAHLPGIDPILTSTNTTNWAKRLVASGAFFSGVTYGKGTFVAVGPTGIFQSEDVATPILSIGRAAGTADLVLRCSGEVGRGYRFQTTTNLSNWTDVANFTNVLPVTEFIVTPDHPASAKLFRVTTP